MTGNNKASSGESAAKRILGKIWASCWME